MLHIGKSLEGDDDDDATLRRKFDPKTSSTKWKR
jgi:hypothetical protein